jgi:hypothetical protein
LIVYSTSVTAKGINGGTTLVQVLALLGVAVIIGAVLQQAHYQW